MSDASQASIQIPGRPLGQHAMIHALLNTGQRLAEALGEENRALDRLDLTRAATLATAKVQATDAFAAAYGAATKTGSAAQGELRAAAERLAGHLRELSEENRRLLERAISVQARVIETIAGAAIPASRPTTYGGLGHRAMPRHAPSLALAARA